MQRIIPNIWCHGTADEARDFYLNIFAALPGTEHIETVSYPTEGLLDFQQEFAGKTLTQEVAIGGHRMILVNAGGEFSPTPAISFFVNIEPGVFEDARGTIDALWHELHDGGTVLMELGEYPHSQRYGWIADRYGVNWQLMLTDPAGDPRPTIIPDLMFGGPAQNRAAEALDHYEEVFTRALGENAVQPGQRVAYGQMGPVDPDAVITAESLVFADLQLAGTWLAAMDSAVPQPFSFTEGVSLMVQAHGQEEIDRLWDGLSAVPEAEQCGWLKDRFGVSWQIVPDTLPELMQRPGAYETLMGQKKIIIDAF